MTFDNILIILPLLLVTAVVAGAAHTAFRHAFLVQDGFAGLLYHKGKLVTVYPPGRHIRWGSHFRFVQTDTRQSLVQVVGQEVLTSDNIGVKLSVVLTTQIVDAAKALQTADNHLTHLYSSAQTAVRTAVAGVTLETLLGQRASFGPQLVELITPRAEALGVKIHAAEVRDVMLPGDLRKAFGETLKARQEGLASLERARGESAALRNLANAARLLESQPALTTLRFLQTLESKTQTLVMNHLPALFPSVTHGKEAKPASPPEAT